MKVLVNILTNTLFRPFRYYINFSIAINHSSWLHHFRLWILSDNAHVRILIILLQVNTCVVLCIYVRVGVLVLCYRNINHILAMLTSIILFSTFSFQDLIDSGDENDPEVQFLKSLTPKQKEKLLKLVYYWNSTYMPFKNLL